MSAGRAGRRIPGDSVRAFLVDSLALWKVEATVEAGASPAAAVIRSSRGATVRVERAAGDDVEWRWFVHWHEPGMRQERSRPCASVVGLLSAVRAALGVERGNALRITSPPAPDA